MRACVLPAPVSTVTSDGVIMGGGKHSARSVERWTFCQYCYGFNFNTETFKFRGDTGPASVILSLSLAHAACCLVSATRCKSEKPPQLSYSHA